MKNVIGILGGTFDPIHFGHLRTALEIQQSCNLQEVRFVPCYQPVHRNQPIARAQDRLAMIKLAIDNETRLAVDACEIERQGPSYMVDTLDFFKKTYAARLGLILGIDALLGFPSWHQWEKILTLCHLIVVHRPLYQLPKQGIVAELLKERLQPNIQEESNEAGSIFLHTVTPLEISASDIRKQFSTGKNPRYLLPHSVYEYIKKNNIYQTSRF